MSKKIASGANAIVLDVKVGEGAFMKSLDDARELARMMVSIANLADRKAIALLSDMNQPLGVAVGNALELKEAINTLRGAGPEDFLEHCLVIAGYMLLLGGVVDDIEEGKLRAQRAIGDGLAWEKFCLLVEIQGGDISFIENPEKLPEAETRLNGHASRDGWIQRINAQDVGETAVRLGAGRTQKGDPIDHSVGIEIFNNVGDRVSAGETLFTIHASTLANGQAALNELMSAYGFSDTPVSPLPLFYDVIQ
jgi:pyrimidine-nucleoside phosphorylase